MAYWLRGTALLSGVDRHARFAVGACLGLIVVVAAIELTHRLFCRESPQCVVCHSRIELDDAPQ